LEELQETLGIWGIVPRRALTAGLGGNISVSSFGLALATRSTRAAWLAGFAVTGSGFRLRVSTFPN